VYADKAATSTLYALSGELFYFSKIHEGYFDTKNGEVLIKHLTKVMNFYLSEGNLSEENLKNFLKFMYSDIVSIMKKMYEENKQEILQIYKKMNFPTMYRFTIQMDNMILMLYQSKYMKELEKHLK
jgi:hypothetical protein